MNAPTTVPRPRRGLSADALHQTLRRRFETVTDKRRQASCTFSMADTLMSAFAIFATKRTLHVVLSRPLSGTAHPKNRSESRGSPVIPRLRDILDGIDTEPLNEAFADLFWEVQRGGDLKKWRFDDKYYLLAIDGSGYFCSDKVSCPQCLVRNKGGKQQFYHQVVAAVLVHPVTKEVLPLAVEPDRSRRR